VLRTRGVAIIYYWYYAMVHITKMTQQKNWQSRQRKSCQSSHFTHTQSRNNTCIEYKQTNI